MQTPRSMLTQALAGGVVVLTGAFMAGCPADDWGPAALAEGTTPVELRTLRKGREVYGTYCVGCHGEKGDGKGPAEPFLSPKPRDFRVGRIKYAAVPSGELPRDDDYSRVIRNGLQGTAMPAFPFLAHDEVAALIAYVKNFRPDKAHTPRKLPVALGSNPWARNPKAGLVAGEQAYHGFGTCWECHPAYVDQERIVEHFKGAQMPVREFRPDLYTSVTKKSDWAGALITPPDFLVDRIKTGLELENLARVIAAGVGGTAMPTWAGAMDDRKIWGIALYVQELANQRGTAEARSRLASLAKRPLYQAPADPAPQPAQGSQP